MKVINNEDLLLQLHQDYLIQSLVVEVKLKGVNHTGGFCFELTKEEALTLAHEIVK